MSMFSIPTDKNMNEMMKPMNSKTDRTKGSEITITPLMVYPLGAAATATAIGFGIAGQMTGMMMGAIQAAAKSQSALLGLTPDLSWMVPGLAEDLPPEAPRERDASEKNSPVSARSADKGSSGDVVTLKPAARSASSAAGDASAKVAAKPVAAKPARTKKARSAPVVSAKTGTASGKSAATKQAAVTAGAAKAQGAIELRRPAAIEKPEAPDDLKLISGVGPKLDQVLNELGIWMYAQVADWTAEEIAWVEDHLQFGGRVGRDDWISQARALAKGGTATG
jgi:NADH-quinone oxidoreductase subunit E